MSVMVVLQVPGMTVQQYETIRGILGEALQPGALLHTAGPIDGGWQVVEIWESPEALGTFFQSEMMARALQVSGVTPGQPVISPVHTHVATAAPART